MICFYELRFSLEIHAPLFRGLFICVCPKLPSEVLNNSNLWMMSVGGYKRRDRHAIISHEVKKLMVTLVRNFGHSHGNALTLAIMRSPWFTFQFFAMLAFVNESFLTYMFFVA